MASPKRGNGPLLPGLDPHTQSYLVLCRPPTRPQVSCHQRGPRQAGSCLQHRPVSGSPPSGFGIWIPGLPLDLQPRPSHSSVIQPSQALLLGRRQAYQGGPPPRPQVDQDPAVPARCYHHPLGCPTGQVHLPGCHLGALPSHAPRRHHPIPALHCSTGWEDHLGFHPEGHVPQSSRFDRFVQPQPPAWGASFCFQAGVPLEHIKKHGTWMSHAVDRYLLQHHAFQTPLAQAS